MSEEHFPEPCAAGGHGRVWCAVCMQTWPCADTPATTRPAAEAVGESEKS